MAVERTLPLPGFLFEHGSPTSTDYLGRPGEGIEYSLNTEMTFERCAATGITSDRSVISARSPYVTGLPVSGPVSAQDLTVVDVDLHARTVTLSMDDGLAVRFDQRPGR